MILLRSILLAALVTLAVLIDGCLPTPSGVPVEEGRIDGPGMFVLCEGLWRQDNSTLWFIADDGRLVRDVVGGLNKGLRLGDTGSDIHLRGDTIWIVVSTSRSIEMFHRRSGLWLGRLRFPDLREPYAMAFVNDSVAVCTFLNDASIAEFNARTLTVRVPRVEVGPAPEGITVVGSRVYVANSGLGDLRQAEPGAGTVYVLAASDLSTLDTIRGLPNVMNVLEEPRTGRVWCTYRHVVSAPDSLGGVVLYDPSQRTVIQHYRFRSPTSACVDPATGTLYVLHAAGVSRIVGGRLSTVISKSTSDAWYSLAWDRRTSRLIIGNARNYVTDGEVLVIDTVGTVISRVDVGINPGSIVAVD